MENLKKNAWKIVLIVLVCTVVDVLLHELIPFTLAPSLSPSVIIEGGLLPLVGGIGLVLTFASMAVVFVLIQEKLPGTRLGKGVVYGIAFNGLWLLAFIETAIVYNTPLAAEVRNWIPDSIPILLIGVLLGVFTATDRPPAGERARPRLLPFLVVALSYLVGRYLAYWVLQTNAAYTPDPTAEFLWTAGLALWMGMMYVLLSPGCKGSTPMVRALCYGLLVIGVDWILFHLFGLITYDLPVLQQGLVRPGVDILFVTGGAFVAELLLKRALTRTSHLPVNTVTTDERSFPY